MYSKNDCHACAEAKEYLKMKGIKFEEVNLSDNPDKRRELVKRGLMSAPIIEIDGKFLAGFSKSRLDALFAGE